MIDSSLLLILHFYFRWFVLAIMLVQFVWIRINLQKNKVFTRLDFKILLFFTLVYNIQLILGWSLYLHSAIVDGFWQNLALGIKHRQMRFFGLEHMSMMTLGILWINVCTIDSYKRIEQAKVFTNIWKNYRWIYLIILSSIPWSFSPLTSRPNFR